MKDLSPGRHWAVSASVAALLCASAAWADDSVSAPEDWSLHGQITVVDQFHPAFHSPYRGGNSLDPGNRGNESVDLTLYAGLRLWDGGEAYANPEIDQGFGFNNTAGLAAFSSGEATKVGSAVPYLRLQRLFFRQTFDLGGEVQKVEPDANQLGGEHTADNVVVTLGKFTVTDIFDTNAYAHDPKKDFLNWAIIDSGAYDYSADSWGYSYGVATEWTHSWWTLRAGLFDLSKRPNMPNLETGFGQFGIVGEAEERHTLWGEPGKLKLLGFINRGKFGNYNDAVALAELTHSTPNLELVKNYASRPGGAINLEQQIDDELGFFARASLNDGSKQGYDYTDIDNSLAVGIAQKGNKWGRPQDTVGVAGVASGISGSARTYFAAGGLGILIGDGRLPHYGAEQIVESYYSAQLADWLAVSGDYQFVVNPAYNRDRGPVSIFGIRLHADF